MIVIYRTELEECCGDDVKWRVIVDDEGRVRVQYAADVWVDEYEWRDDAESEEAAEVMKGALDRIASVFMMNAIQLPPEPEDAWKMEAAS